MRRRPLSLVGNLADLGLGDIFQIVSLSRRSGTLQLTTSLDSGEIIFQQGLVVATFRAGSSDGVGEGLLAGGLVNPTDYQDMLIAQSGGLKGEALLEHFRLKHERTQRVLAELLKADIYRMLEWDEGGFSFVLEATPDRWRGFSLSGTRVVVLEGINPQYLAMEGARRRDEEKEPDALEEFLARNRAPEPSPSRPVSGPNTLNAKKFAEELGADPAYERLDAAELTDEPRAETPGAPKLGQSAEPIAKKPPINPPAPPPRFERLDANELLDGTDDAPTAVKPPGSSAPTSVGSLGPLPRGAPGPALPTPPGAPPSRAAATTMPARTVPTPTVPPTTVPAPGWSPPAVPPPAGVAAQATTKRAPATVPTPGKAPVQGPAGAPTMPLPRAPATVPVPPNAARTIPTPPLGPSPGGVPPPPGAASPAPPKGALVPPPASVSQDPAARGPAGKSRGPVVPPPASITQDPAARGPSATPTAPPARPRPPGAPPAPTAPPETGGRGPSNALDARLTRPRPHEDEKVIPFPAERVRRGGGGAAVAMAELEPSPPAPQAEQAASGRILVVVDDDPDLASLIGQTFSSNFTGMVTANSVVEARRHLEHAGAYAVLAVDLILPRSDGQGILGGLEVLERARQAQPNLPAVMFTDYHNVEAEGRARGLGAGQVLVKPRRALMFDPGTNQPSPQMWTFLEQLGSVLEPHFGTDPIPAWTPQGVALPTSAAVPPATPAAPLATTPVRERAVTAPTRTPTLDPPTIQTGPVGDGIYDLAKEIAGEFAGEAADPTLPPAVPSEGALEALRAMLAELADPSNRETVTLLVLRFAADVVDRAALFLTTKDGFIGLGGFCMGEASDEYVRRVRRVELGRDEISILEQAEKFRALVRGPLPDVPGNRSLLAGLAKPGGVLWHQTDAMALPLVSADRVTAVLYGDNPTGRELGRTDALEIFMQQAGMTMDRVLLERQLEETRKRS